MTKITEFLVEVKKSLPAECIKSHESLVDVVGRRQTFIELFPSTVEQTVRINMMLNQHDIKFHTISTGKNWGLGSNFPPPHVSVVVNLSRLDKIIQYNAELGYVEIQPGVTQAQLSSFLIKQNSDWYIDVTGSGTESSILGNSLARGISYNHFRVDRVMKLRVLLPNGQLDETGFKGDLPICHLYRWGIGPDNSGLYFQSDKAIVLSGTMKLERRPECFETFSISYDPKRQGEIFEAIQYLQHQEVIRCNVHIANYQRYFPVMAASIMRRTQLNEEDVTNFVSKFMNLQFWMGTGVIFGNRELVKNRRKVIAKTFKGLAKVTFVSERKLKVARFILKNNLKMMALLDSLGELRGFAMGQPSNIAVAGLAMFGTLKAYTDTCNIDQGDWGVAFYSPVGPYEASGISKAIKIIEETAKSFQFDPAITVNAPGGQIAEYVVSVHYQKTAINAERALGCIEAIRSAMNQVGILPYRLGIWQTG